MRSRGSLCVFFALFMTAVSSPALAGFNRWTRSAADGGDARSIAVDRHNDGVVYAAVNGVIHKSDDAGRHWQSANDGVTSSIFAITISPSDSAVLYAAGYAGERQLLKSSDGGQHWKAIPAPNQLHGIARLTVTDAGALLAASDTVVDRTTDDGVSWQRTFTSTVGAETYCCIARLIKHPDGALFLFHTLDVYRSTDGGRHWNRLPSSPDSVVTGAIDDADGTIYVETVDGMSRVIYRSRDLGATWSQLIRVDGPVRSIDAVAGRLYISRGCDPEEIADIRFCRNSLLEYDGSRFIEQNGFVGTAVNVVVPAGSMRILATTDGAGILTTTEGSAEWTTVNTGLPGPTGRDVAVVPRNASSVYAVTGGGLLKSDDYATTWRRIGDAGWQAVAVDPIASEVAYVATADGILKTIDGGSTFTTIQAKGASAVTVAPSNAMTIYAALFDGMAASSDAGRTWRTNNTGITLFNRDRGFGFSIHAPIVVDPHDDATAYVARDEALYKTTTAGATWSPLLTSRLSRDGFADFWGHTVTVDPSDSSTLYVTSGYQGGVVSHDGGTTWASASFAPTVRELIFDPAVSNVVYAIHSDGALMRSDDRGLTFSPFDEGLEGASVYDLAIDASGYFLYAATSRGTYTLSRLDLSPRKRGRAVKR